MDTANTVMIVLNTLIVPCVQLYLQKEMMKGYCLQGWESLPS